MRTSTIAVGLLAAVLLTGGCGSEPEAGDEPASQTDVNGEADAPDPGGDQPAAEGEVDAPNPGGDQPSAELPGLPIGGQVPDTTLTASSPSGCGTVAWVGPNEEIPDGIEIAITAFHLPDQVTVDDSACGGAQPACLGGVSFWSGQTSCNLGVTWNGETPETLSISADGTALCDDQAACDQFKDSLVSQTAFLSIEVNEAEEEVVPEEEEESSMSPSVTDTPSEGTE